MITLPQVPLNNKFAMSSTIICFFLASKNFNFSFAHGQNKTEYLIGNTVCLQHKVLKIHMKCPSLKEEWEK